MLSIHALDLAQVISISMTSVTMTFKKVMNILFYQICDT